MTDQPATIAEALAELQQQLPHIGKAKTAKVTTKDKGSYSYTYADLAIISRELLPLMAKLGLSFSSKPTFLVGDGHEDRFGLAYTLRLAGTNETDAGFYPLPDPQRTTPQQVGSAITYARRYCLCAVTGLAPDDDDDGAAVASKRVPQRTRAKVPGPDHERLQPRRQPGDRPAERGPIPPGEDLWQDQPAGQYDETPPEERTGSIDGRQRSQIFAKFAILGITDATAQREALSGILRRPVDSRKDLSYRDAEAVLKDLQARVEAKEAAEEAAAQDAAAEATP